MAMRILDETASKLDWIASELCFERLGQGCSRTVLFATYLGAFLSMIFMRPVCDLYGWLWWRNLLFVFGALWYPTSSRQRVPSASLLVLFLLLRCQVQ